MARSNNFYVDQKALKMTYWAGMLEQLRVTIHAALQPVHEEFQPRTMWSLSNEFTSAFKEPEPIPQYKATAKLAAFLQAIRPS